MVSAMSSFAEAPRFPHRERIALSLPTLEPFFERIVDGAKDAAKAQEFDLLIQNGENNPEKQASNLREAIGQGIDGIAIFPSDESALLPVLDKVIDAKIPIVTVYSNFERKGKTIPNIGVDDVTGGGEIAKYIIQKFPDGARIALITGPPGSWTANDRARGFKESLMHGGYRHTIIDERPADWNREKARDATLAILTSHPPLPDVIVALNDNMALGASVALQQLGLPRGKVTLIGYDGTQEALENIKEGTLTATVDWFPKKLVKTAISALLNHSRNGAPLESSELKPLLVDESNLESAKLLDDAEVPVATPTPTPTPTQSPTPTPTPNASQNAPDPYVVPVFYATNRALKIVAGIHGPGYKFTSERSPDLKFGSVVVKVPHGHRRGIVERPGLDWLFFLTLLVPKFESERPADHFILSDLRVLTEEDFVQEIRDTGTDSALLYVHGFNTSFEDGIFTLAQIKFDSQYPGIAVAFSWPSGDNLFSHGYATASADFSRKPFLQVVNILKTRAQVSKIYVIAHSLGNRIVADSLGNDRQAHLAE